MGNIFSDPITVRNNQQDLSDDQIRDRINKMIATNMAYQNDDNTLDSFGTLNLNNIKSNGNHQNIFSQIEQLGGFQNNNNKNRYLSYNPDTLISQIQNGGNIQDLINDETTVNDDSSTFSAIENLKRDLNRMNGGAVDLYTEDVSSNNYSVTSPDLSPLNGGARKNRYAMDLSRQFAEMGPVDPSGNKNPPFMTDKNIFISDSMTSIDDDLDNIFDDIAEDDDAIIEKAMASVNNEDSDLDELDDADMDFDSPSIATSIMSGGSSEQLSSANNDTDEIEMLPYYRSEESPNYNFRHPYIKNKFEN